MGPDLLQPPAYVLGLAYVASFLTSALKGPVERILPPANKWHDLAFTLFPVAISLGLVLGYMATHGGDLFLGVVWGLLSGVGAVGSYLIHTRTGAAAEATTAAPDAQAMRTIVAPPDAHVSVTVPPAAPTPSAATTGSTPVSPAASPSVSVLPGAETGSEPPH